MYLPTALTVLLYCIIACCAALPARHDHKPSSAPTTAASPIDRQNKASFHGDCGIAWTQKEALKRKILW